MKRLRWIALGLGFIALGALLDLRLCERFGLVSSARQTAVSAGPLHLSPQPSRKRQPLAPLSLQQLFAEGRARAAQQGSSTQPLRSEGPLDSPLERALEVVIREDEVLRSFFFLRKKALRTTAEQKEYQVMLANEDLIKEAHAELRGAYTNVAIDQIEELRRLLRIQYLNAATAWKENPSRPMALAVITALLLEDIPDALSSEARGSLRGDKFDLYQHLMLSDPDKAQALLARAQGTRSENILRLARQTGELGR